MAPANVSMNVRKVGDTVSIVDIEGEMTATAESALMDAYTAAMSPQTRAVILNRTYARTILIEGFLSC